MNLHIDRKGTNWWVCEYQARVRQPLVPNDVSSPISFPLEGPFRTRVEAEWCFRKRVRA